MELGHGRMPALCSLGQRGALFAGTKGQDYYGQPRLANTRLHEVYSGRSERSEDDKSQGGGELADTITGKANLTIFSTSNDNWCVQWEMTSSGWGDVDEGAGVDPSLSAALVERITGSSGVQKVANVKRSVLAQNQLDDSLPKIVKGWLWK